MIDTHCHIDLYNNPIEVIKESERENITVIAMTNLPSHFEMGLPYVLPFTKIRLSLGMHPLLAEFHEKEFEIFKKNLSSTSYIGEVGLDFSKAGYSTKERQIQTFSDILKIISGKKKVISLHSRMAEKEVFRLLKKNDIENAIFHWYSGSPSTLAEIANAGYFFSVNTAMFKSNTGRNIVKLIPLNRILTESDGPHIEYQGRPAKPNDIQLIEEGISEIHGISREKVSSIIWENFMSIIARIK